MYNKDRIRELLEERKIKIKDFMEGVGAKSNSLAQFERDGANPTADTLEKIADFFQIPIDELFNREMPGYNIVGNDNNVANITINSLNSNIESLEAIIEEKDKRIRLLEDMVEMLREQIKTSKNP